MRETLVSVIIPVYNAEKYVRDVLSDILNQTYRNLEVIVVNDGSTDNTVSIIDSIAEVDRRVIILNTVNGGVSKARNIGLEVATGEYIRFVDADDRVPKDSIEKMIKPFQTHTNIDIVIGNYICVPMRNYMTGLELNKGMIDYEEFIDLFSKYVKSFYFGVTWNKLYRRHIIEKNNLRFDETMYWCEDFIFNIDYYSNCSLFYLLKTTTGIYEYCKREGSITEKIEKNVNDEKNVHISNIRYKKMLEYCRNYLDEETLTLEWKYAELFNRLSYFASVSCSGKHIVERYREFKNLLKSEDVYKYVCGKEEKDKNFVWRIMKKAIERNSYWKIFLLFSLKEFVKSNSIIHELFLRKNFKFKFPKNF